MGNLCSCCQVQEQALLEPVVPKQSTDIRVPLTYGSDTQHDTDTATDRADVPDRTNGTNNIKIQQHNNRNGNDTDSFTANDSTAVEPPSVASSSPVLQDNQAKHHIEILAEQAVAAAKQLVFEKSWKEPEHHKQTLMFRPADATKEITTKSRLKWQGVVRGVDPPMLAVLLGHVPFHFETDKELLELRLVETISDKVDVRYSIDKYPWPLTNRDNCFLSTWEILPDGEIMLANKTINHPACPESQKLIRMEALYGYILDVDSEGEANGETNTVLTIFADFDVKGSIPKQIIEAFASDTCGKFDVFSKFLASKAGQEMLAELRRGVTEAA